jgi:hypothetical protein
MSDTTQANYERRLAKYTQLINGVDQNGLICKLQLYRSFLDQHRAYGENLWKIEPLLLLLIKSLEQDLHLSLAKFFEDDGYGIKKFTQFCLSSRRQIKWSSDKSPNEEVLLAHEVLLEKHKSTISSIRGRRDKYFAHTDKKYLETPDQIYTDFPLTEEDVVKLAQALISIVHDHEIGLHPDNCSFHLAEFIEISVDNMVRNLKVGRKINFPDQQLG